MWTNSDGDGNICKGLSDYLKKKKIENVDEKIQKYSDALEVELDSSHFTLKTAVDKTVSTKGPRPGLFWSF